MKITDLSFQIPDYSKECLSSPEGGQKQPTKITYPELKIVDHPDLVTKFAVGDEIEIKVKVKVAAIRLKDNDDPYDNMVEFHVISMEVPDNKPDSAKATIKRLLKEASK